MGRTAGSASQWRKYVTVAGGGLVLVATVCAGCSSTASSTAGGAAGGKIPSAAFDDYTGTIVADLSSTVTAWNHEKATMEHLGYGVV